MPTSSRSLTAEFAIPHGVPRLLATDLDGTLLRPDGSVSPRTAAALATVQAAGIEVVFVTARPHRWLAPLAGLAGAHGSAICHNGASVIDMATLTVLEQRGMSAPIVTALAERLRASLGSAAQFLLCMLAYYVQWHMRQAWGELMFADTDDAAKRSDAALSKVESGQLDDGTPVHSFSTLMAELSTIVRNICRAPAGGADAPTFEIVTTTNPKQRQALELIKQISP
jgi:hypothetical protein